VADLTALDLLLINDNVLQSLRISKIRLGYPVWGGYVSALQMKQINALLRRFFKCCFTSRV